MVNKRGAGRLEIKYLGGPEIVKATEVLGGVGKGVVDIAISGASYYSGIVPEGVFMGLPIVWTYDNYLEIYRKEFADQIDKAYQEKANVKVLALADIPHFILATTKKKPITRLEDLKGKKIRGAGGMSSTAIKLLGAAPVRIPSPEILTSIERGTADAAMRPISAIVDWSEYDVLNYVVMPHLVGSGSYVYMNLDTFNKLPADLQKLLTDTAREAEEWDQKDMKQREAIALFDMYYKYGVEVYWLPSQELKRWNDLIVPGVEKYFTDMTGAEGQKMLDTLKKYAK
jgi:TRAP-type C4-dicarboxylate transport system substrate-binding protein